VDIEKAAREIIGALMFLECPTHDDANRIKMQIAAKYHLERMLSNAEIIAALSENEKTRLLRILRRKGTRVISGVTVVAVMTKPIRAHKKNPARIVQGSITRRASKLHGQRASSPTRKPKQL